MRIVQINTVSDFGSTGKICAQISHLLDERSIENFILFSSGNSANQSNRLRYANSFEIKVATLLSRIAGNWGFENVISTRKLLKRLNQIKPDLIHIHNIHSHACNLDMLFSWVKKHRIPVVWTFHDCWAFTGYCTHFLLANCKNWEAGCGQCPQFRAFSFFFDKSRKNLAKKQRILQGLNLQITCPSYWLGDVVKKSFLKDFPITVIPNGIDLNVFQPKAGHFRERYGIKESQKIILGVAFDWDNSKGLDVFIRLSNILPTEDYQIVLVGTNEKIEKRLPPQILSVRRTKNQDELAMIYSAADVFLNPTRADTFPTVNMESLACGTPVITFDTGGSPEIIDEKSGLVVHDHIDDIRKGIETVLFSNRYSSQNCMERAKSFEVNNQMIQYVKLYESINP